MEKNEILKIYGTDYKEMTKELLREAGLSGIIPGRNARIGLKPNLVSASTADYGATTHPEVVAGIIEYLQDEGFEKICVMEGSWVGDSTSPYYNQMVDIRQTGAVFDTAASEHLSTYGGKAYHYCMAVGYNKEQTPYKGSAIFLHCMDGPGTGGCIAIPEEAMVKVLQNVSGQAYILIDDGVNLANY